MPAIIYRTVAAHCGELQERAEAAGGLPRVAVREVVEYLRACVGGRWEIWEALSCDPFEPVPQCAFPGRHFVEPSGPFEPADDEFVELYGGSFELSLEVRDDGRLYVLAESGSFDPGTCRVSARSTLNHFRHEEGQGSETVERTVELYLSGEPFVGNMTVECSGECEITVTAPVTGTRLGSSAAPRP